MAEPWWRKSWPALQASSRSPAGVSASSRPAATSSAQLWRRDALCVVESTIDDLDPRQWPDVLESLQHVGALDVWLTPVLMRKGRPGHVLTVLVPPALVDAVVVRIAETTPTLGVRVSEIERRALHRDEVTVDIGLGTVPVKRGLLGGRVVTVQPEYREVRALAETTGRPVDELIDLARVTARALPERAHDSSDQAGSSAPGRDDS
jgi:hypothetical protein